MDDSFASYSHDEINDDDEKTIGKNVFQNDEYDDSTHFSDCDGENLATGIKAQTSTKKKKVTFLSKKGAGKENRKKKSKDLEQSAHSKKKSNWPLNCYMKEQ